MRKNGKIKVIILGLGIIFAISTINNQNFSDDQGNNDGSVEIRDETNLKNPKNSYTYLNPITIDDNGGGDYTWAQAVGQSWCTLVGGVYIIDDVAFNPVWRECALIIRDSTQKFIVQNSLLSNAWTGHGIYLENVQNGQISNNDISNNDNYGVKLEDSSNINITDNTITNNGFEGVFLRGNCDNNRIHNNIITNNGQLEPGYDVPGAGIYLLSGCNFNNITENDIGDNDDDGIYIRGSNNIVFNNTIYNHNVENDILNDAATGIRTDSTANSNTIKNNTLSDNTRAIYLDSNSGCTISGNIMTNCGIDIKGSKTKSSSHNIDSTNKVNGKSVYYYSGEVELKPINFTNAGQVILADCHNSTAQNVNVSYGTIGALLLYCENITLYNFNSSYNSLYGIRLINSDECHIIDNEVKYNGHGAVAQSYAGAINLYSGSDWNNITGNTVNYNEYHGIELFGSDRNIILLNTINGNDNFGVCLDNSDYNNVTDNTILGNLECIHEEVCTGNIIENNNCGGGGAGVVSDGGGGGGGGGDGDDDGIIPFGNIFIIFTLIGIIATIIYNMKRKIVMRTN